MANATIEDTLNQEETAAYKAQAVNAKFKQQLSYGIGAAMVFGLASAVAGALFKSAFGGTVATAAGGTTAAAGAAVAAGSSLLPIIGIVALGVIGVGLLYMSANYLSENTLIDQAMAAKQINAATRGKAPVIAPTIEGKVNNFPSSGEIMDAADAPVRDAAIPDTRITGERALADTIVARGAANENKPADASKATWEAKMTMNDEPTSAQARA